MYNLTNVTDANNFYAITKAVNFLSEGLFIGLGITSLIFILFMGFKVRYNNVVSITVSCAIGLVVSILFWGVGFVGVHIVYYPLVVLVLGLFFAIASGD